ncbi:uncharacterized protein JCM6883_006786 [Sporobolomyces salmoneus]|uniref:uncharacterized protein n=1 Tax=Sporobolomyces salmoneus TaxID=183962 RepID=UPI0031782CBD
MSEEHPAEGPKYPSTLAPPAYYTGLTDRIRENLLPVFSCLFDLPTTLQVLELASGNGLHSLVYSQAFPNVTFQPTECDAFNIQRIDETCREVRRDEASSEAGGVRKALELDVMKEDDWQRIRSVNTSSSGENEGKKYDLVVTHNCLHMLPFPEGPQSIFRNLLQHKLVSPSHGLVAFYGPFKHDAGFYGEADEAFDREISSRPSSYPLGLRSIEALARIARNEGWEFVERVPMPKGNFVLIYKVEGAEYPEPKWD